MHLQFTVSVRPTARLEERNDSSAGALERVRVLDLSGEAGQFCGKLMGGQTKTAPSVEMRCSALHIYQLEAEPDLLELFWGNSL
jgi:hypothetical protein